MKMTCEVKNHMLCVSGKNVSFKPSPNHGGVIKPCLIVIHYTGDNSKSGAISWLCAKEAKVSAHLVVGKDGTITQLLPFNVQGWHAGQSSYNGRSGVNNFSIGIENVGVGDNWPSAQVEANRAIIEALFITYPDIEDVVGHKDIAIPEGRKTDPGPLYPWGEVTI